MKSASLVRSFLPLLAVLLFLAAAGPVAAQTPRWEYQVVSAKLKNRPLAEMLNSRGAEGWELVAFTRADVAVFKRPVR